MLDHYLRLQQSQTEQLNTSVKLASFLKDLPEETLLALATGKLKVGFASPKEGSCGDEWLAKFHGTPLFEQATALEKADLENEIAHQQLEATRPQDETWKTGDQIRLQKKLLELQLFEAQGAPVAAPAVAQPAQGAGAPGDMETTEQEVAEPARVVTASVKLAWADGIGRQLARAEHEKIAQARETQALAKSAGQAMAKIALDTQMLGGLASKAIGFAKKHPQAVGAGIGAIGGAVAGGPDHRISGALGGAALGASAGGIASNMSRGQGFGTAVKNYGSGLKDQAMSQVDKLRNRRPPMSDTPAPTKLLTSGT